MVRSFFSVFDAKASSFSLPFVSVSQNVAIRDFATAVNDPASQLNMYPADFSLYRLGDFDDISGLVTSVTPPEHVVSASSLLRPKGENDV